ncbi:hypothetical protein BDV26DRAFT_266697, partial [Aspergillus bertholletiae]
MSCRLYCLLMPCHFISASSFLPPPLSFLTAPNCKCGFSVELNYNMAVALSLEVKRNLSKIKIEMAGRPWFTFGVKKI